MSVAKFVDLKRNGRGGSSQPGGWREGRTLQCFSTRGEAEI